MTEITLENLCKNYGNIKAIENVNLEIKDKEFMVLLGPSGCGKTTTLLTIAGLEKPTSGNILFSGKVVNDLEPKERNVAMVFQEYALYPHMSVFDNLSLCLKVDKVPKGEIMERVQRTADLLEIDDLLDRKPGQLSGGQQQRVALGRAIIRNPSVYLLDEPLSNLDAILRSKMRVEIKKLHKKLMTTTVYVTHDQAEAMMLSDRIAVMKDGKLIQVGTPDEIYHHPSNKFVGEFVGAPAMNFISCSLIEKNSEFYLDAGSFCLKLNRDYLKLIKERPLSSEMTMGVRPQSISVSTEPKRGLIEAEVHLLQPVGDVTYATLGIGSHIIVVQVSTSFSKTFGERVFIKFDEKHLFDKKSEKRIV